MKPIDSKHLTAAQFRRLADIKDKITALESEFNTIAITGTPVSMPVSVNRGRLKRKPMSAEAKSKLSAAAKKRWKKARAAGKNSL